MNLSRVVPVLCVSLPLHGCGFYKLESELASAAKLFVISGWVTSENPHAGDTVVSAYRTDSGRTIPTGLDVLKLPGRFAIILPAGKHKLGAFQDTNGNKRWDPDEPAAYYGEVQPAALKLHLHDNFDLTLVAGASLSNEFPANPLEVARQPIQLVDFGASVSLDAPTFAPRYGRMGLWEPYTFIYEAAPGLYVLEPYDSNRIPILFVHGAGGTPQDWRYFISRLDKSKYQAWIYHYASGLPLELNALYLNRLTGELRQRHAFDCMFVAAHSVGGLVAKRFIDINRTVGGAGYIALFISIATPWGGVESAELGVEHAPVAIPSWVDMSPDSRFLNTLYSAQTSLTVPHALLFAYGRDREFRLANTDGRVTLESQLDPRIKNSAFAVDGFNADHAGILRDEEAFQGFARIIDGAARIQSRKSACPLSERHKEG